jgi:hypothetical protein
MAKTYIELVNIALRDINEVPITEANFPSPRGLQAAAKEMVNRAYADILNYSKEWPFLSEKTTAKISVDTVNLQPTYTFDTGVDRIDWDSFFITSADGSYRSFLQPIDIDFYVRHLKVRDLENSTEGGEPIFVYRLKSDDGFGLSPYPDDSDFTVTFAAWSKPTLLTNSSDTVVIPDRYYTVLISRARYFLWMFRENVEQAEVALNEYERGLRQMHRDIVDKQAIQMKAV